MTKAQEIAMCVAISLLKTTGHPAMSADLFELRRNLAAAPSVASELRRIASERINDVQLSLELLALANSVASAMPASPVASNEREGFVLVPAEPNDAMQAAGAQAVRMDTTVINKIWTANAVFRAMVSAARTGEGA